ncbi:MAG: nitrate/nitrite transporter [Winogradskyella sp.]|uniref:MFS transporter n=1 Tax=Winogradskyella sp. TaxID=1883156 RepID=UPI00385C7AD2
MKHSSKFILPIIVISQFCCTSLWFAGNGIIDDLVIEFNLSPSALGYVTSAIQFGFISGTLVFSALTIADRFSPSRVFFVSALIAALFNLGIILSSNALISIIVLRYFTGFFLAGIYPIGMKIAADYYKKGLGKSLGFLVGALVLGTAFPHLLNGLSYDVSWLNIIHVTSLIAFLGGLLMLVLVPDGPYRNRSSRLKFTAFFNIFKNSKFRAAAFGYFGHMWELYAFWAFVPVILKYYVLENNTTSNVSLFSFLIIAIGGLACVLSGYLSEYFGAKRVAVIVLSLSGLCCLLSPVILSHNSSVLVIGFLLFWGMVVIADSPLFSSLVAENAEPEIKGTALTIVNCIGFAITIISIQLLSFLSLTYHSSLIFMVLALGPIFGLMALIKPLK